MTFFNPKLFLHWAWPLSMAAALLAVFGDTVVAQAQAIPAEDEPLIEIISIEGPPTVLFCAPHEPKASQKSSKAPKGFITYQCFQDLEITRRYWKGKGKGYAKGHAKAPKGAKGVVDEVGFCYYIPGEYKRPKGHKIGKGHQAPKAAKAPKGVVYEDCVQITLLEVNGLI